MGDFVWRMGGEMFAVIMGMRDVGLFQRRGYDGCFLKLSP